MKKDLNVVVQCSVCNLIIKVMNEDVKIKYGYITCIIYCILYISSIFLWMDRKQLLALFHIAVCFDVRHIRVCIVHLSFIRTETSLPTDSSRLRHSLAALLRPVG